MYIRVPVSSHPRHNWRGKRTDTVIYLPFLIQKPPPWDNSNFKHSEGNRHGEELENAVVSKRNDSWLLSAVRTFLFTWTLGSKCTRETGWKWAYYCRALSRPELAQFVAAGFETTWHVPNMIWTAEGCVNWRLKDLPNRLFKKRQLSGVGVFGETKEVIDALTRLQQGVK